MSALDQAATAVPRSGAGLSAKRWNGDFRHLESDVAAVAHHLRTDLDLKADERAADWPLADAINSAFLPYRRPSC